MKNKTIFLIAVLLMSVTFAVNGERYELWFNTGTGTKNITFTPYRINYANISCSNIDGASYNVCDGSGGAGSGTVTSVSGASPGLYGTITTSGSIYLNTTWANTQYNQTSDISSLDSRIISNDNDISELQTAIIGNDTYIRSIDSRQTADNNTQASLINAIETDLSTNYYTSTQVNNLAVSTFTNDAGYITTVDYTDGTDVVGWVGNWSLDKSSYYTSTEVDNFGYSTQNNCSVSGSCPLITYDSELDYTTGTDVVGFVGNWTLDKTSYYTSTQVNNLAVSTFTNDEGYVTNQSSVNFTEIFVGNHRMYIDGSGNLIID